jgi:hypothetical protein
VGPRAGVDDVEERKFLTLQGHELRPLGRPARSPTMLSGLPILHDMNTKLCHNSQSLPDFGQFLRNLAVQEVLIKIWFDGSSTNMQNES